MGLALLSFVDIRTNYCIKCVDKFNLLFFGVLSLKIILYSFEDIMNKVVFRRLAILPSSLLFYSGLFLLIYFLITISIFIFVFQLYDFKNDFDYLYEIQFSILYIPFNILRNYNILNVIDKFSAQHMTFLRVMEAIILFGYIKIAETFKIRIKSYKNKNDKILDILQIIGFIFLFFSTLIHNEIIIINHPKLREKTQYYLDKDADLEQISSVYTDTFTTSRDSNSNSIINDDLTGSDMSQFTFFSNK